MGLWDRIAKLIPRPFKYLQRQLDIESEWAEFKDNMRPHRYKIRVLVLIISYPLYAPYLHSGLEQAKHKISDYLQK